MARAAVGLTALCWLLAVLVSCADSGEPGDAAETSSAPTRSEASRPSTSESTTPTEPPGPTAGAVRPQSGTLRSALVPGSRLPALNLENPWRTGATRGSEPDPPAWVCQRVSMLGNGAVASRVRSYTSAGTSTASQVVAGFADARSARRAFGSLLGNARDCAVELAARGREPVGSVQPLTSLELPGGAQAGWGVVFSGPVESDPNAAHIDAVVVVRAGDRVSVVSMHSIGQDYDYPPGQSPPERAAQVVAARLPPAGTSG